MITNEVAGASFGIEEDGADELSPELLGVLREFDVIIGEGMREWARSMEESLVDHPMEHLADMPLVAALGGRVAMTAVIGQKWASNVYQPPTNLKVVTDQ